MQVHPTTQSSCCHYLIPKRPLKLVVTVALVAAAVFASCFLLGLSLTLSAVVATTTGVGTLALIFLFRACLYKKHSTKAAPKEKGLQKEWVPIAKSTMDAAKVSDKLLKTPIKDSAIPKFINHCKTEKDFQKKEQQELLQLVEFLKKIDRTVKKKVKDKNNKGAVKVKEGPFFDYLLDKHGDRFSDVPAYEARAWLMGDERRVLFLGERVRAFDYVLKKLEYYIINTLGCNTVLRKETADTPASVRGELKIKMFLLHFCNYIKLQKIVYGEKQALENVSTYAFDLLNAFENCTVGKLEELQPLYFSTVEPFYLAHMEQLKKAIEKKQLLPFEMNFAKSDSGGKLSFKEVVLKECQVFRTELFRQVVREKFADNEHLRAITGKFCIHFRVAFNLTGEEMTNEFTNRRELNLDTPENLLEVKNRFEEVHTADKYIDHFINMLTKSGKDCRISSQMLGDWINERFLDFDHFGDNYTLKRDVAYFVLKEFEVIT